ncbi:MAG: prolyl aminopeptidase [Pseudomonadota bacterium]
MEDQPRGFYPSISPYRTDRLDVGDGHTLYYEECGNPLGKPVVVLHGGPGSGSNPMLRRLHDPQRYRIILFDQRGCGRSRPYAALENNTTDHLVADIDNLRNVLGITRWQVLGGSWGSTLALAYAVAHPDRVSELVLRGIFLMRQRELDWFYTRGASELFPEHHARFLALLGDPVPDDIVSAYHALLTDPEPKVHMAAARAWSQWEGRTLSLIPSAGRVEAFGSDSYALAFSRIECHYFYNKGFFPYDGWLLDAVQAIRHIPCSIVHGRYDVVTPVRNAYDLQQAWPEARYSIVPDAGHAVSERGIARGVVAATDYFADR